MPAKRRTEADIRNEMSAQREQLAGALVDLREGINAKRRTAAKVGAVLATGVAAVVAFRVVRGLTGE